MRRDTFSPDEAVRLAIQIEQTGLEFYQSLRQKTNRNEIRAIVDTLIVEEGKHKRFFEHMLSRIKDRSISESSSGDYAAYMQALSRETVYADERLRQSFKKKIKTADEVLGLAVKLEADSIMLYQQILQGLSRDKKVLKKIIAEEQRHYSIVSALREKCKGEGLCKL